MSDIPSTGPENSAVLQQTQTPSSYERVLGKEYPIQSTKIKGVIIDVKDKNITIINNPEKYSQLQETKKQTEALSEDFKQEFINRLKENPYYNGTKVQEVIENGNIEIKNIPGRDLIAIYEGKIGNLIFISKIDGKEFFNIDKARKSPLKGFLDVGYKRLSGVDEKNENGIYNLYKASNKIDISSDEYLLIVLKSIDMILNFEKDLGEEIERREKLGIE